MHLAGTDLNFDRLAAGTKHDGMNGLVAIGLRVGDVIIKLIRQMAVVSMHYPQRGIAVLQALGDNPHRPHVKQLVESEMFFLHFAPDAIDMLRTTVNLSLDALGFHFRA